MPVSIVDKLASAGPSGSDKKDQAPTEAWRPRLELGPDGGFAVSTPRIGETPDAADVLEEFNLDPDQWIVTSLRRSRWQRYDGEWLEAVRVTLAPAGQTFGPDLDLEQLVDEIKKWRPRKGTKQHTGDLAALFNVGDTQWGKDAGDGTEGTVRRMMLGLDESVARFTELVKTGRSIGTVALPQLGDCVEGSASQGGKVLGQSDLGVTSQVRVGRRILMQWVKAFAPLVENLIVPAVPGNHDEPHRIVITAPTDSWQIEVVSAVQDACAENPELAHVQFRFPEPDSGALTVDLAGTFVGFVHGHQSRDLVKWWSNQATGRTAIGSADVLITAHFHHFKTAQVGPRLWIQVPAMDGGSPWFRERHGLESPTGIVSLVVGAGYDPRRDLCVIGGEYR